jgi:hypothetical protein
MGVGRDDLGRFGLVDRRPDATGTGKHLGGCIDPLRRALEKRRVEV